jgi:hypothetical protein
MPRDMTARVGICLPLAFVAGSYPSRKDDTRKKLTNTSSGASTFSLMPARRSARDLQSVRFELKWHAPPFAENCDQATGQVKFLLASRGRTVSLTNSCVVLNWPSNRNSPNDCFRPVGPLARHRQDVAEPHSVERLGVDTLTTVTLPFSVPPTVRRFSVTESGTCRTTAENSAPNSIAQMVIS